MTARDRPAGEDDATYSYDLLGRLVGATDFQKSLSFSYDALGRTIGQTSRWGTIVSTYDLAGRRTRITHPDGFFVEQDWTVTGELSDRLERRWLVTGAHRGVVVQRVELTYTENGSTLSGTFYEAWALSGGRWRATGNLDVFGPSRQTTFMRVIGEAYFFPNQSIPHSMLGRGVLNAGNLPSSRTPPHFREASDRVGPILLLGNAILAMLRDEGARR